MKHLQPYNEFFPINEELTRSQRAAVWLPWALISKAGQKLFNIYPMLNLRWNDLKQKTKDSRFDPLFSSTGTNAKMVENLTKINDLPKANSLKLGMLFRNWNIYLSDRKSKGGAYGDSVVERTVIYLSKDEIKKGDYCNFERLNDYDVYSEYKNAKKPENEEDCPIIILAAKYSEKENLDVLQETIKDIWLEFTDEYSDFEIEPYFNLAGDYLKINIKFNNRVIRLNPGHSSKVKDEKFIKFIEELSESTKGLLENEFGTFNHKMTFKIDGRLTYTGNDGRFGTEIIPSLKKSASDIYNQQYKMLSIGRLGLSDDKLSIGVDDIQTLLDDIDKCYTTDDNYFIEVRPEENKANGILISGISIIFRKKN